MKKTAFCLLILVFFLPDLLAQDDTQKHFARQTSTPVIIDGVLNDSIWRKSEEINEFIVFQPGRLDQSLVQTSVKAAFDKKTLYVGFVCKDKEKDKIRALVKPRDGNIKTDDSVFILLDLFENIDNYFFFGVNTLGTQADGIIRKDGLMLNSEWNGDWEVRIQQSSDGWTAEIAINLTALMFVPEDGSSLGVSFSRVVPRLDSSFWTEPLDPAFRLSEMEGLGKLTLALVEKWVEAIPYVMVMSDREGTYIRAGIDVPLKFTNTISSQLTINPDFFTVEPDQEVFNLTRYELCLPEKREYFRKGLDKYQLLYEQLFYSKRIGDIYGGFAFFGEFGALDVSATSNQSIKNEEDTANFSVVRLNSRILGTSTVGLLAANKLINGQNFGTVGLDTHLSIFQNLSFKGQLALSYGDYGSENLTFSLFPSYETETFHFHIGYSQVGANFGDNANTVGYIWDDNRREVNSSLIKTFVMQKWGIEYIKYISNYDIFWGTDRTLRSWQIDQGLSLMKQNRFEVNIMHREEYKLFEEEFRNRATRLFIGLDTREWQLFNILLTFGYNFGRTFRLAEINKRLKITQKLFSEFAFQSFNHPCIGGNRTAKHWMIFVIRSTYNINRNIFLKGFFQYNELNKKSNLQIFLFYRFKQPAGMLQFGYQYGDPRYGVLGDKPQTLFVKCSYAF